MSRRTTRCWQRGGTAIEFTLIAPLLIVVVLGIIDTGRLIWTYTTLARATQAAARCAAINTVTCGTTTTIKNYAATQAWGLTITASAFTVTAATCGWQVQASYPFTSVIPGFDAVAPIGLITLTAKACFPV